MDDKEVFAALAAALKPMNTTKDIADNCGIKEGTLAYWRSAGIGPKFVKVGRIVMYPKEQMIAYFAQHLYQCTAERIRGRGRCAMTDNDWRTDTPWPDPWEEKENK